MNNPDNFQSILDLAVTTAREAAVLLHEKKQSFVTTDLERDVKIEADHTLHAFIVKRLRENSPYPVLSEEDTALNSLKEAPPTSWIVDPVDGSLNFSRGIPLACISIGFLKDGQPLAGVVYDFYRQEMFSALDGLGAWLNGAPIRVSSVKIPKDAILMTGFPTGGDFSTDPLLRFVEEVQRYKKIRLLGSAALSLAYVASGRADIYQEKSIALWDVTAGLALVKAAGGSILLREAGKPFRFDVVAGNSLKSLQQSSLSVEEK